jgi:general secretion pathway protein A
MYNQFFGLRKKPFNMTPDPGFLFLTAQHREALVGLTYAILDRKGFVVLTGDAGTGKTTLLARVLQYLPANRIQSSVILNPTLTPSEFLELAMLDFGISDVPPSKAQRLARLQNLLLEGHSQGKVSTLVIDEAHKLSPEVLEEIRLLGNFEYADQKLIQILLVGQNELNGVLDRDDLRQLKQRIALRFAIAPLAMPEVEQYIRYRWAKAGGQTAPFSGEAVAQIVRSSRGIPRVINAICDNALMSAFSEGSKTVNEQHVREAAMDLKLGGPPPAPMDLKLNVPSAPAMGSRPAETPVVQAPAEAPEAAGPAEPQAAPDAEPVLEPLVLRTFERYNGEPAPKTSVWMRWASKLGLGPKKQLETELNEQNF